MSYAKLIKAISCTQGNTKNRGFEKISWGDKFVEHEDFTDLGNYVIDLGEITIDDFEYGLNKINTTLDAISTPACTAIVKRNSSGEVIIGRNMDLEVSNYAAYIAHYIGGQYCAIGFGYNNKGTYTYAELQQMDRMPEGFREIQAAAVTDAFNEKGLYIQCNMRTGDGHLSDGTNPGAKRINIGVLAAIVAQNCSTVKETLNFIQNELDVYSTSSSSKNSENFARSGWDLAYLVADATGEYGVIEFANNEIFYTPYANCHSNAYVHPNLNKYNTYCGGFGREAIAMDAMIDAETANDMFEAVHKADLYQEILDIKYSYRDKAGTVHFVDKYGNPSIDYRSEVTRAFCVSDDGEYLPESDEWIITLTAIATGETITCSKETKNKIYELASEIGIHVNEENLQDVAYKIILHYHENCTLEWITDDENFESVKQAFIDYMNSLNAFELLDNFLIGDDQGLRDSGDIFTTVMCFGINCNEKYLKVRFMEQESCIYEYQW